MINSNMIEHEEKIFLTPIQLAKRWHSSTKTLANMRCEGEGPAYFKMLTNRVLYDLEDVILYENERRYQQLAA